MKTNLLKLIDFEKVDTLLEGFNKTTGFVTAILDLEGKVLSKSGWRTFCTDFHRINPETSKKCTISDTELAGKLAEGEKYHFYQCLNGLVDVAVPIVIKGEHIANLFSGQFFFEEPNRTFFKKQAERYGFNETKYLEALEKVPVVSQEKVQVAMGFLLDMTQLISETLFQKQEQAELNKALRESEEEYRHLIEFSPVAMCIIHDWKTIYFNPAAVQLFGAKTQEEILGKHIFEFIHPDFHNLAKENAKLLAEKGYVNMQEQKYVKLDGSILDVETQAKSIRFRGDSATLVIMNDITVRKKAVIALAESRENLSITLNSIGDGVISTDINGLIVQMNPVAETLCGWKLSEALGRPITEVFKIINAETRQAVSDPVEKVLEKGEIVGLANHTVLISKDGIEYQIADSAAPIKNKEGAITGVVLVFSDVTEKYAVTEAMSKSQEMMVSSQSVAHICSYSTNLNVNELDKSVWDCSPEFYKVFGIDETYPHTIAGWAGFIHPEHREELVAYHEYVVKSGISFDHDYKIIRVNNGAERWVQGTGELEYDEQGKPVRMYGAIQDITERKQFEEALRKSEAIKNKMVSNIGDVIVIIDQYGKNTYKSPNITTLFGWKPEELVGQSTWDNVHPDDLAAVKQFFETIASVPNANGTTELRYRCSDGNFVWIEIKVVNLLHDNDIQGILGNYHEISERRRAEQELIAAKEKAEESDRLKSAFLANMSHEIRTPMNGILGFSELLKEPDLKGEQQQEYIKIIEKSGARMLNIINDIIDISKIEAGLMKLNRMETNINEQIEFIYTFFKPEVDAKGMKITFNTPLPAKDAILETDREKVYAILTNLVKNAIKYSNEGTIEVGYVKAAENLQFYVKDTGIGIQKDRHEAIFERFIQADIADKMANQGAGLGLSITKAYVEMLGGKIWVESELGIGSTFYFTLPYQANPTAEYMDQPFATSDHAVQIRKLKILIAEDDDVSEKLLDLKIKPFAKEILKARTGIEAVDFCQKNPDIDLILMDIRMPEMNGYEATRQIREFNKSVVIIAQTAYGLSGDREKSMEAGCNGYLTKPINNKQLFELIQNYFGK